MQSFRSELEDLNKPVVANDIIQLEKQIRQFRDGKISDDKFRSLRLARGIYGQRQQGVQMIRIKLPLGRVNTKQLRRIADMADEYGSGNLHATTRQDIQLHFVSLERTPELWANLEKDDITLREACGNTVRNITTSATAGIDPAEPFDVSPYAYEMFQYFLRNPVCQEMGRKIKIAFSSSNEDTAFTFIHDLGFIPRIENNQRGFKVVIGGGLGANPYLAETAFDFLHEDQLIPFAESVLRVFDRYGERTRRMKARLKFLLNEIGLSKLRELIVEEKKALKHKSYKINREILPNPVLSNTETLTEPNGIDETNYHRWFKSNVFEQKQKGFYGVYVKVPLGNISSDIARKFADIVDRYAANELRVTINQGYLVRFVRPSVLKHLYVELNHIRLAQPGFDSVADVTACPGTESCNLAISGSTVLALELERVVKEEYPDLIFNSDIKIKISGCPNSCGQHGLASIGLHGSTIKDKQGHVIPALVVLLGGGKLKNGEGIISDKIIKIPSKRGADALRLLLDDYEANSLEGEYYHQYFQRLGRIHFYTLLKPLTLLTSLRAEDYVDWGEEDKFILHTATGECAGVIIDLVATLLYESEDKLEYAHEALNKKLYADSIYYSYSAFINSAKALLLTRDSKPSTQHQVIQEFDKEFVLSGDVSLPVSFSEWILRINKNEPDENFARLYYDDAQAFTKQITSFRQEEQLKPTR